jgi:serralysin
MPLADEDMNNLAVITGTEGDDTLAGGPGADVLIGLGGHDDYVVDDAGDVVVEAAEPGIDEVFTTLNAYTLPENVENLIFTGTGNFAGTGNGISNFLMGGAGDDTLDGGAWSDTMMGGAGSDDYYVDNAWDQVWESAEPGIDEVFTTLNAYTLPENVENLIFTGSGNFAGTGNGISNFLMGGAGDDTLDGGAWSDTMMGGAGSDDYYVDNAWDQVWESAEPGIDEVFTTLNAYTLPENVENLIFTGTGNFAGTGNGISNFLMGGAGDDTLDGGAWSDTMMGGAGDDTYLVDNGWDQVWEAAGGGQDQVLTTLGAFTLGEHVEGLRFIGSGDFAGTGNALDNRLEGGAGDDVLTGLAGADVFVAGAGADLITDFTLGEDRVALAGHGSFEALLPFLSQQGADVQIALGEGVLTLAGIELSALSASDFLFG